MAKGDGVVNNKFSLRWRMAGVVAGVAIAVLATTTADGAAITSRVEDGAELGDAASLDWPRFRFRWPRRKSWGFFYAKDGEDGGESAAVGDEAGKELNGGERGMSSSENNNKPSFVAVEEQNGQKSVHQDEEEGNDEAGEEEGGESEGEVSDEEEEDEAAGEGEEEDAEGDEDAAEEELANFEDGAMDERDSEEPQAMMSELQTAAVAAAEGEPDKKDNKKSKRDTTTTTADRSKRDRSKRDRSNRDRSNRDRSKRDNRSKKVDKAKRQQMRDEREAEEKKLVDEMTPEEKQHYSRIVEARELIGKESSELRKLPAYAELGRKGLFLIRQKLAAFMRQQKLQRRASAEEARQPKKSA